jgi:hypothetical protein
MWFRPVHARKEYNLKRLGIVQFRILIGLTIFLGSYLPLSLILLAQDYDYAFINQSICLKFWSSTCALPFKNPLFALGIFFMCAICFLATCIILAAVVPKQEISIEESKYIPTDLMNYTIPYIVSLMSVNYHEPGKFVGFVIFLGWMFWITHKSGQVILNPLLIVLGWRLYDVSYKFTGSNDKHSAKLLAKGSIEAGKSYRYMSVQDILVIKNKNNSGG